MIKPKYLSKCREMLNLNTVNWINIIFCNQISMLVYFQACKVYFWITKKYISSYKGRAKYLKFKKKCTFRAFTCVSTLLKRINDSTRLVQQDVRLYRFCCCSTRFSNENRMTIWFIISFWKIQYWDLTLAILPPSEGYISQYTTSGVYGLNVTEINKGIISLMIVKIIYCLY